MHSQSIPLVKCVLCSPWKGSGLYNPQRFWIHKGMSKKLLQGREPKAAKREVPVALTAPPWGHCSQLERTFLLETSPASYSSSMSSFGLSRAAAADFPSPALLAELGQGCAGRGRDKGSLEWRGASGRWNITVYKLSVQKVWPRKAHPHPAQTISYPGPASGSVPAANLGWCSLSWMGGEASPPSLSCSHF